MAEAHVGPLPEGTKHCRVCAEPINKVAQKCIHCQSEQNRWRQRLGFSSTILSLLVALVAVLTAAVPVFKEALTPKNSSLSFSFVGATHQSIGVIASNSGTRPGAVRRAFVSSNRIPDIPLSIYGMGSSATFLVAPGNSIQINFYTEEQAPDPRAEEAIEDKGCRMGIIISVREFIGEPQDRTIQVECRELSNFIHSTFSHH